MAGLDPAISIHWASYSIHRDRRVKPGDDGKIFCASAPHIHMRLSNSTNQRFAGLALCFSGGGGARIPVFRLPSKTRGWSASDLGFTQDRHLKCASRVNPTCDGARGLRGPLTDLARVRSIAPTAISPLPGIAAIGVRAASDGGRCASRGSTADALSAPAPRSVIRHRYRRRPR
jgi:hypothetical protein